MRQISRSFRKPARHSGIVVPAARAARTYWPWFWAVAVIVALGLPAASRAETHTGASRAGASLDFRIVIPAMIRVHAVTQPAHIVIDEQHVNQGFIDLDAGTSVNLTSNNRDGYVLTTRYDPTLLSAVEVRISSQTLTASSGTGSMRVTSGFIVNQLVPISYRLHLAPGVRAGEYRWPVALAFSLAAA